MNTKLYIIILASSFGLIILGSIIGGILESSGTLTREILGVRGDTILLMISFALFCVMAFALVPLVIRFFIVMQIKIGNGEFFLIQWFQAHEHTVVYCAWGMLVLGLVIIFSLAKNDILNSL